MYSIAGNCGKCGAPFQVYSGAWFSVTPPPIMPSCACWNTPRVVTTTTTEPINVAVTLTGAVPSDWQTTSLGTWVL